MSEVRILIVDDNESWRQLLVTCLQGTGWYTDTAADLDEARRLMSQSFYDLLILDIRLDDGDPDNQDGIRFLEELTQVDQKAPGVVMLSGYGTREMIYAAYRDFHFVDFLNKGTFDDEALVASIAEWLPRLRPFSA